VKADICKEHKIRLFAMRVEKKVAEDFEDITNQKFINKSALMDIPEKQ
jgi:hypothetical protein